MLGQAYQLRRGRLPEAREGVKRPAAVGRNLVAVAAGLVGGRDAPRPAAAVETRCIQVALRGIVRRGGEVDAAALLVHAGDIDRVERAGREQLNGPARAGDAVQMPPAVAFAQPQEASSLADPAPMIHHVDPGVVAFGEHQLRRSAPRVAAEDAIGVLQPVELLQQHGFGIRGPLHAWDVVVAGVAARVEPASVAARRIDDADTAGGVRLPGLRILVCRDLRIERIGVVDEAERRHAGGVELPIGDAFSVGAPAEAVTQIELLLVHPVRGAVDRASSIRRR